MGHREVRQGMPRAPRYFVDGAFYHVYGRVTRGEPIFAAEDEASRLVAVVREVKRRDGLTILAWCVMGNHYHLAVRTAAVPLWRSIRLIQWRYAREYNRRNHQLGPLWQGRYQVRLVEDQRYLVQLVAYVHLNPVAAGIVNDAAAYRFSGHRELLGRTASPLIDRDVTLALFGDTRGASRRAYVRMLRGERDAEWVGEQPGRLPWWGGRDRDEDIDGVWDRELAAPKGSHPERIGVPELARYLESAAVAVGVSVAELGGRGKAPPVVRAREVIALVGVERFGVRIKAMAARLGMNAGSVSRWVVRGAARRTADADFAGRCLVLERTLARRLGPQWR